MKNLHLLPLCILIIFCSCDKDNGPGNCKVSEIRRQNENLAVKYDQEGRFQSMGSGSGGVVLSYYQDSIVQLSPQKMTYFLNTRGLADSAIMRPAPGSPIMVSFQSNFKYNDEGFMVEDRTIFSQLYNGNFLKDTFLTRYEILSGNVVKTIEDKYHQQTVKNFEYIPNTDHKGNVFVSQTSAYPAMAFLGKPSRNLVSKITNANGDVRTVDYSFNINGYVSRMTFNKMMTTPPGEIFTEFIYDCK